MGIAAAGLAAALCNRQRARRAEARHPPLGRFVEAGGLRLHYLERGEGGPPIVLLHGNGAMVEDFALSGLIDLVARHRRVVAFDRPGFGHSARPRNRLWTPEAQAAVLVEAFTRLGLERPVVLGHSWGTLVALALALNHPQAVGGLVLASGYYFPTVRADVPFFAPPAIPVIGDVIRYTIGPPLGRLMAPGLIRRMFQPAPVTPRFKAGFPVPMMLRPWQIRASAEDTGLMVPAAAAFRHRYQELRLPVAILAGEGDRIVDVGRQSARLHRTLPQSVLTVVPGLGHMLHHDAPELVAGVVEAIALAAAEPDSAAAN
ncbi:alpha/beta fold hydrolase [Siccirubricoccus sp. G192]|uniref:alpha/beta fold hydrolase n=1 Tax=Siccirubricoccus sp. G192 TaxID=2849651 RepID=UPI001C2B9345|nr:alpha/beta hydrolase [Siccirubricoccus sp. G192]MBV1799004.1 alpha/beta hydrolase [Siccirubricoccus sp. G192]